MSLRDIVNHAKGYVLINDARRVNKTNDLIGIVDVGSYHFPEYESMFNHFFLRDLMPVVFGAAAYMSNGSFGTVFFGAAAVAVSALEVISYRRNLRKINELNVTLRDTIVKNYPDFNVDDIVTIFTKSVDPNSYSLNGIIDI